MGGQSARQPKEDLTEPASSIELNDEERGIRDLCRDFAAAEIAPHAARWWQEERCPTEVLRKMGKLDLFGLLVPERYGGTETSARAMVAGLLEIGRVDQSLAAAWQAHLTIGTLPLLAFGNEAQKERWLVPLASGEKLGSFGLTEPSAGSDVAAIRTRAVRRDDDWEINGSKTFISNAATDMSLGPVVLARTAGSDGSGEDAPSYASFMVPLDTEGFSFGPKMRGIGWHALDSRELSFDGVLVGEDHLIGEEGGGLRQFLAVLDVGRITVAALGIGLTEAVLQLALEYAKQRRQFGKAISEFQAIQFKLADIAAELEAVRLLLFHTAGLRDAGRPFGREGAIVKLLAARLAVRAASEAVQIHGGYGYMYDYPVSRFYCDAKVLEIGEGTNEIQQMVIARSLGC
jgi:alkylation response protein AidB-like acyl-CoA dehydrogenase